MHDVLGFDYTMRITRSFGDTTNNGTIRAMIPEEDDPPRTISDVAMWHLLSGTPDNVTEDGELVRADAGLRLRAEKELLRGAIDRLRAAEHPEEVRSLARLAGSYLLAGDAETSMRYVNTAQQLLATGKSGDAA